MQSDWTILTCACVVSILRLASGRKRCSRASTISLAALPISSLSKLPTQHFRFATKPVNCDPSNHRCHLRSKLQWFIKLLEVSIYSSPYIQIVNKMWRTLRNLKAKTKALSSSSTANSFQNCSCPCPSGKNSVKLNNNFSIIGVPPPLMTKAKLRHVIRSSLQILLKSPKCP